MEGIMKGLEKPHVNGNLKNSNDKNGVEKNVYKFSTIDSQLCKVGLNSDVLNSLCSGFGLWVLNNKKRKNTKINYFPKYREYFRDKYLNDEQIENGAEVYKHIIEKSKPDAIDYYDQLINHLNSKCRLFNLEFAYFETQPDEINALYDKNVFTSKFLIYNDNSAIKQFEYYQYLFSEAEYKYCLESNQITFIKNAKNREVILFDIITKISNLFHANNLQEHMKKIDIDDDFLVLEENREMYIN